MMKLIRTIPHEEGVSIPVSDPKKAHEALAGPDPEPMNEDQTGSDSGKLHVSLAGPNPEAHDEFLTTATQNVHELQKLITDERASMINHNVIFGLYDQEKSKVREESDSTIPDSSHQTVTSTPPLLLPSHSYPELRNLKDPKEISKQKEQDDIPTKDEGNDSDMRTTDNATFPSFDHYVTTGKEDALSKLI
ncbi:hypothetical protein Tco_0898330 [Tanacetum coccineum]